MIMIWNRKEIFSGFSLDTFCNIRERLAKNNIKYTSKVINRTSSSLIGSDRSRDTGFGHNFKLNYEYYIYVHKDDYELAISFINKENI